ncbi:MAG: hypothetical protein LBT00_00485 [Spirochaetaceae bacterium]|nr:hypothetical protein [Spirochaetaceae bacterium]
MPIATKQSRRGAFSLDCRATLAMTGGDGRNDARTVVIARRRQHSCQRRSNPDEGRSPLDCHAPLAMTGSDGRNGGGVARDDGGALRGAGHPQRGVA